MMIRIRPAAFNEWLGVLTDDEVVLHTVRGPRPGCVARDLINWIHYNLAQPSETVVLEIKEYE